MRCKYCHNPDTWEMHAGESRSAESLIEEYEHNRAFYKNGGITVSGGEPLAQIDFLLELFRLAKEKGIHTCLDTSGGTYRPGDSEYNRKLDALMELTDLVMLDIKHMKLVRWAPDAPKLYTVTISSGNDSVTEEIGFRNIGTDGTSITVNGRKTFMRCISFHEEIPQRKGRAFSQADAQMLLSEAEALGVNIHRLA